MRQWQRAADVRTEMDRASVSRGSAVCRGDAGCVQHLFGSVTDSAVVLFRRRTVHRPAFPDGWVQRTALLFSLAFNIPSTSTRLASISTLPRGAPDFVQKPAEVAYSRLGC